jgi:hypothetical protein
MPSTITAVSSRRATTPVARLVYQSAVLEVIPFTKWSLPRRTLEEIWATSVHPLNAWVV